MGMFLRNKGTMGCHLLKVAALDTSTSISCPLGGRDDAKKNVSLVL